MDMLSLVLAPSLCAAVHRFFGGKEQLHSSFAKCVAFDVQESSRDSIWLWQTTRLPWALSHSKELMALAKEANNVIQAS